MKLSAIISICKQAKHIKIYSDAGGVQWISDGYAIYPLYGLPLLDEDNLFTLFDIPADKRSKFHLESVGSLPASYCFSDVCRGERPLEARSVSVCWRGTILRPFVVRGGIVYIDNKYLKPFSDSKNGVTLFERADTLGKTYLAVKDGLLLAGLIAPYVVCDGAFAAELCELSEAAVKCGEDEFEQIGMDEAEDS